jgi:hypothetical protein
VNIEERLSLDMKKAAEAALPGRPLSWTSTLARGRRRRASHALIVALCALAVGAAAAAGVIAVTRNFAPVTRPAAPKPPLSSPLEATAMDWIDAIAGERYWTAWRMLGPASRSAFGGFGDFEAVASTDLKGSWARWAGAEIDVYQTPVSPDEGSVVAMTMVGEVDQQGSPPALDAEVLVVRALGSEVVVEPRVGQYPVDLRSPQSPPPVAAALVPGSVPNDVVFRADVTKSAEVYFDVADLSGVSHVGRFDNRDPAGIRTASWKPPPLPPGRHVLTVVSSTSQGQIDATAVIFTVD